MTQAVRQSTDGQAPVVIGKGMIIKGSIHSKEDIFLNGEVEGDLDVENCRLTIGPDGKVVANARAREVDISGTMTGNVDSTEKTSIRASGQLTGDVRTGGIVIETGAQFKGRLEIITGLVQNNLEQNQLEQNHEAKSQEAKNGK